MVHVPRSRVQLVLVGLVASVGLVVVVVLVSRHGLPGPDVLVRLAEPVRGLGPALPVAFVGVHVLATVTPFPRTAFSLAAGILFGPALGLALALLATTLSAVLALLLVRRVGREAVVRRVHHRALLAVDAHLRRRGWPAVVSLRLVPVVPFWLINYGAGISAVRWAPFAAATLVGAVPGTAAIVLLGGAAGGGGSPTVLVVSVVCGSVGLLGLARERRTATHQSTPGA